MPGKRARGRANRPGGDTPVEGGRRVYVIELSGDARPPFDPRFPRLYVGETSHPPEERFRLHQIGHRASADVKKHGVRLRPELYEDLPAVWDSDESESLERRRAEELRDAGHWVRSNGKLSGIPKAQRRPFDRAKLEPIMHHLDVAIRSVVLEADPPVGRAMCAHVLYGSRGEVALRYRTLAEYGRFAHAAHGALRERIRELLDQGLLGLTDGERPTLFVAAPPLAPRPPQLGLAEARP